MNFKSKIAILFVLIGLSGIAISSCTKKDAPIKPICNLPQTVSFTNDILPIFNASCNTAGCHTGTSPSGNLDLDPAVAYTKLMKAGTGYIDTINPNYSLLYSQLISTSKPMPPTGKLDDCKTSLIFKWIQQKAKNN
jgi:hypothetical protein